MIEYKLGQSAKTAFNVLKKSEISFDDGVPYVYGRRLRLLKQGQRHKVYVCPDFDIVIKVSLPYFIRETIEGLEAAYAFGADVALPIQHWSSERWGAFSQKRLYTDSLPSLEEMVAWNEKYIKYPSRVWRPQLSDIGLDIDGRILVHDCRPCPSYYKVNPKWCLWYHNLTYGGFSFCDPDDAERNPMRYSLVGQ